MLLVYILEATAAHLQYYCGGYFPSSSRLVDPPAAYPVSQVTTTTMTVMSFSLSHLPSGTPTFDQVFSGALLRLVLNQDRFSLSACLGPPSALTPGPNTHPSTPTPQNPSNPQNKRLGDGYPCK